MTDLFVLKNNWMKGGTMNENKKFTSDFLFPNSSFAIGFGSVLNIFGNYYSYNASKSDLEADSKALLSDVGVIGQDMTKVLENVKREKLEHNSCYGE